MPTAKMNPEIKELWVNALTSGDYKQGQCYLSTSEGDRTEYCCWGVLSDLAVKAGITTVDDTKVESYRGEVTLRRYGSVLDTHSARYPPREVLEWAGIDTDVPVHLGVPPTVNKLADWNDDSKSFKWIAAYIKRYL